MQTVSVSRRLDAPADEVERAMNDLAAFMRAARFDEVTVDGETIVIRNVVGFLPIELTLEVVERPDAVLAYVQREGIFSEMETRYELEEQAGATEVTATTEFELAARFLGPLLDATIVKRQRRRELTAQFDHLEEVVAD